MLLSKYSAANGSGGATVTTTAGARLRALRPLVLLAAQSAYPVRMPRFRKLL
jgi:hypothetical protein